MGGGTIWICGNKPVGPLPVAPGPCASCIAPKARIGQPSASVGAGVPQVNPSCRRFLASSSQAHNQRGYITMEVRGERDESGKPALIWIEELIDVAESSASAPLYPLLKRSDERHVTMQAYENPVFVEDMVRNVAAKLQEDTRVQWFQVHVVNHESIHNHNAFAKIQWTRPESS